MEGIIKIDGQIGDFNGESGVNLSDIISQVKKQPDATSYRVLINSEGGRVDVGFDIYNYLNSLGLPITTVGNGLVASVATVIFMVGDKRLVREGTVFMIHHPMGSVSGTVEEIENYTKAFKKVHKKVLNFYMDKFGMQAEAIEPLLKNQTWLNAEQLSDLGITTDQPENIAAVASIKLPTEGKEQPKNKTPMSKSKEKSVLEQMIALAKSAFSDQEPATNKILLDANTKEVVFPALGKNDTITVGAEATIENQPAEGQVVLQDGRTLTFEKGKVMKIEEAKEEKKEGEVAELETLRAELATVKAEKETAEAQNVTAAAEIASLKSKLSAKETILNSIMKLESQIDATPEERNGGNQRNQQGAAKPSRMGKAIANIK